MNYTVFLTENSSAVIGVISSFTALVSVLLVAYGKRRDANIREAEIKLQQEQFIAEKRHQITQSKRQELFQEKIAAYLALRKELNNLRNQVYEVGMMKFNRSNGYEGVTSSKSDIYIQSLNVIFEIVEKHYFLMSEPIIEKYKEIHGLYKEATQETDFMDSTGAMDPPDISKVYKDETKYFFKENQSKITSFFEEIERELKQIKKYLDI